MDKRTDFRRPRGHAFLAEQARRVLSVPAEIHELSDVPLPLVHTALGVAVCALAVLLRPQAVGLRTTALLVAALAVATATVLTVYDLLVYAPELRPGPEATALPMAAVVSFECVMAGSEEWPLRLGAAGLAAVIIGGVPHLGGLRAAGRERTGFRLAQDAAGIAVLVPVMLAGVAPSLQWWSRGGLVLAVVALVTFDTLRTEDLPEWLAAGSAAAVGWMVAGAAAVAGLPGQPTGARTPALLLVLWYGLRGLVGGLTRRRRLGVLIEYLGFAAAALIALQWLGR